MQLLLPQMLWLNGIHESTGLIVYGHIVSEADRLCEYHVAP